MSCPVSSNYYSPARFALCLLLTISFSACSNIDTGRSPGSTGTGEIAFRLAWQRPPLSKAKSSFSPSFNACVDYAIDTVSATVYDSGDNVITSASWPCSAHEGLITTVLPGSNYTVRVDGKSLSSITWNGLATAVTVTTDQVADAGTIVMDYIGDDTANPAITNIDPASEAVNVPVTARVKITFSESISASTVNTTNIKLTLTDDSDVPGSISYDGAGAAAVFTPSSALAYNTQYILHALTGVTDLAGNALVSAFTSTFTTEIAPVAVPAAPSSVTAKPGNGQITLDWLASSGAASYNVHYGLSSGVTPSTLTGVQAPLIHMGLTNDQPYYYLIEAVNSYGTATAPEATATPVTDTLASGLIAYYPFSGNADDASGNGNNGTVSGATLTTDRFEIVSNAYDFDGSASDISLGSLAAIDDYSVSLWLKKGIASGYPSAAGEADLFGTQTSAEPWQYFKFGFNNANQDKITVAIATTSTDYLLYTSPSITDTNWHHLVVTRSGASLNAYLDDEEQVLTLAGSAGNPSGTITSGSTTKLGTVGGISDARFDGVLDDTRIYSRVLSTAEIGGLYEAGNPNAPTPPVSLSAVPGSSQNVITWPLVSGATGYNLYWSTSPISPDKTGADHVIRSVTSPYTHMGLVNGQAIYYIVTATNSYGESTKSMQTTATPN